MAEDANLEELGNAVDIDIDLEERESSVGNFSVDLFATETGSGRKIIIENQLEDTNHDHLGKLITYASGKGAEVIIWIVKRARDEHRQAIELLNQHTDSNIGFFLVEIELWQINDSLLAPKFNVVEKPNDWAKAMKSIEGMSETDRLNGFLSAADLVVVDALLQFREVVQPVLAAFGAKHPFVAAAVHDRSQDLRYGTRFYSCRKAFHKLQQHKETFEQTIGKDIVFHDAGKSSRILLYHSINVKDRAKWSEAANWLFETALKFKRTVKEIDK